MTIQRLMVAPHIPFSPIDDAKKALRAKAIAARVGHDTLTCGEALAAHVLLAMPPPIGAIVAGFWPIGDEIDVRPLLSQLRGKGHEIVLPITPKRGNPLTFGVWSAGEPLIAERFGTMRPTGPERIPTFLLVPLLAFDRTGARLGYGIYEVINFHTPLYKGSYRQPYTSTEYDPVAGYEEFPPQIGYISTIEYTRGRTY